MRIPKLGTTPQRTSLRAQTIHLPTTEVTRTVKDITHNRATGWHGTVTLNEQELPVSRRADQTVWTPD